MNKNIIEEFSYLDMLKGFGQRIIDEPKIVKDLFNITKDMYGGSNIKAAIQIFGKNPPINAIGGIQNLPQDLKLATLYPNKGTGRYLAHDLALIARPTVPLAAGAYGVHKALEDDSIVDKTVDNVKDAFEENPYLSNAAITAAALASGAGALYLRKKLKEQRS